MVVKNMRKENVQSLKARSLAVISRAYFGTPPEDNSQFESELEHEHRNSVDRYLLALGLSQVKTSGAKSRERQHKSGHEDKGGGAKGDNDAIDNSNDTPPEDNSQIEGELEGEHGDSNTTIHPIHRPTTLRRWRLRIYIIVTCHTGKSWMIGLKALTSRWDQPRVFSCNPRYSIGNGIKRLANQDIEQPSPKRLDQMQKQVADVSKSITDLTTRSDRQDMSLEQLRQLERELQETNQRHDETLMKQLDEMATLEGQPEDLSKKVQNQDQSNENSACNVST
ncbi:hypothetical protein MAJ_00277, partial [Metarhizium majus ARSEF 297]